MTATTVSLIQLWAEARTRFTLQFSVLAEVDLKKTLGESPNSIGFLIRHIGDVERLFAKNVFGDATVKVSAKTVIEKADTGVWTNLSELNTYLDESCIVLRAIIEKQTDDDWATNVYTHEFGTKTKAEALGRIASHTAYHAGQIALIQKYGNV